MTGAGGRRRRKAVGEAASERADWEFVCFPSSSNSSSPVVLAPYSACPGAVEGPGVPADFAVTAGGCTSVVAAGCHRINLNPQPQPAHRNLRQLPIVFDPNQPPLSLHHSNWEKHVRQHQVVAAPPEAPQAAGTISGAVNVIGANATAAPYQNVPFVKFGRPSSSGDIPRTTSEYANSEEPPPPIPPRVPVKNVQKNRRISNVVGPSSSAAPAPSCLISVPPPPPPHQNLTEAEIGVLGGRPPAHSLYAKIQPQKKTSSRNRTACRDRRTKYPTNNHCHSEKSPRLLPCRAVDFILVR